MREKNAPLDLNKILKFWVLVTASVTPLIYLPIGGILNPYFPKLVFLIVIFIILIMKGYYAGGRSLIRRCLIRKTNCWLYIICCS